MAGYIRNDVTNEISDTNVINAAPLNGEFDAVETAFNSVSGHRHDGTSAEGAPITVIGPAQDVIASALALRPKTDNTIDLGSTTFEYKDLWIDGTANIDSLIADTADINAGTIDATVIGATTPAAATVTSLTATSGAVGGSAITTAANTQTLTNKTLTSPVITGGTIDGVAPATVSGTQTLTNKTINLTNNTLVATSAQLAAAITDETGTGAIVFAGSPALTGIPTAPTAAAATNTTQLATTAHVFAERTNTATLTNKTLTSPTISGGTVSGITDLAIADGGTGASTAPNALINFGLTATAAELNIMDGVTATGTALIQATDATAARVAIGAGQMAVVTRAVTQSIPNTTDTAISWDNVQINDGTIYAGGSPTRLTVPTGATRALVTFSAFWAVNNTGTRNLKIRINNTSDVVYDIRPAQNETGAVVSRTYPVTAGDYFEAIVSQNSGGALNIGGNNATVFSLEVLR